MFIICLTELGGGGPSNLLKALYLKYHYYIWCPAGAQEYPQHRRLRFGQVKVATKSSTL